MSGARGGDPVDAARLLPDVCEVQAVRLRAALLDGLRGHPDNHTALRGAAEGGTNWLTVALTTDSFVKSQGVPGRASFQSPSGHRDTLRQIGNLELSLAPSATRPIGVDASVFGVHQDTTFTATAAEDDSFPTSDITDISTAFGGQLVARGAIGAHHVPGVLVASNVERFAAVSPSRPMGEDVVPGSRYGAAIASSSSASAICDASACVFSDRSMAPVERTSCTDASTVRAGPRSTARNTALASATPLAPGVAKSTHRAEACARLMRTEDRQEPVRS